MRNGEIQYVHMPAYETVHQGKSAEHLPIDDTVPQENGVVPWDIPIDRWDEGIETDEDKKEIAICKQLFQCLKEQDELKIKELEQQLSECIRARYGIDGSELLEHWKINDLWYLDLEENFFVMQSIDSQEKGALKVLYEDFGIIHFLRHQPWVLIEQYRHREDDTQPFGMVVLPYQDGNSAFALQFEVWESLVKQLHGLYRVRFFEAGSKKDVIKQFKFCDSAYVAHDIGFLFLGGHGEPDRISFGKDDNHGKLRQQDVENIDPNRLKNFFVENVPIILISCSTGADGGIAESLSKVGSTKVIAPNKVTILRKINVNVEESGISFDVVFSSPEVQSTFG